MGQQKKRSFASPLRYPGGKGALADFVKLIITQNALFDGHYVELYAGGAGIAWQLLFEDYVQTIHINDLNKPLIAFWRSVTAETEALCQRILDTPVTVEEWRRQRQIFANPQDHSQLELGFSLFFLNRTNRSGILNGGIIGGKNQTGAWKIDARFNKIDLVNRIQRIARHSHRINIYNLDAGDFIQTILPTLPLSSLVYLDPPYFKKGQELYENHYTPEDHKHIAQLVSTIRQPWLVSYDSCPEIDALYSQYNNIPYKINYSAQDRYAGSEVIFLSNQIHFQPNINPIKIVPSNYMQPLF